MSNLDPEAEGKKCRCFEPAQSSLAPAGMEPVVKIGLPEGMTDGTFTLMGMTAEELGREVDRFMQAIDFERFEASAGFSVAMEMVHFRAGGGSVVRSAFGPYHTDIHVWRRK